MGKEYGVSIAVETKVTRILIRVNFESLCFLALCYWCEGLRNALNIADSFQVEVVPAGELRWSRFKGRTAQDLLRVGILCFNVGEGEFDQHGNPANAQGGGALCSLDLVLKRYNFLNDMPWLQPIIALVIANDVAGTSISSDRKHFREAMSGMLALHRDNQENAVSFLLAGFHGVFTLAKQSEQGTAHHDPFSYDKMIEGVQQWNADLAVPFKSTYDKAFAQLEKEWIQALADFAKTGDDRRRERRIFHSSLGRNFKVSSIHSDSLRAGHVLRKKGFDVGMIVNPDGHIQIVSRILRSKGGKKMRLDLAPIVVAIRQEEARVRRQDPLANESAGKVGHLPNADENPWYFAEFRSMISTGTIGNRELPGSQIRLGTILRIVVEFLPFCALFERSEDNTPMVENETSPAARSEEPAMVDGDLLDPL